MMAVIEFVTRAPTLREAALAQRFVRTQDLEVFIELLVSRAVPGTPRAAIESLTGDELVATMAAFTKASKDTEDLAGMARLLEGLADKAGAER